MKNLFLLLFCFVSISNMLAQQNKWPESWSSWVSTNDSRLQVRARQLGQQENPIYTRWEIEWRQANGIKKCGLTYIRWEWEILEFGRQNPFRMLPQGLPCDSNNIAQLAILEYVNVRGVSDILNSIFIEKIEYARSSSSNNSFSNNLVDKANNIEQLKRKAATASINSNHQKALDYYKEIKRLNPNEPSIDGLIRLQESSLELSKNNTKSTNSVSETTSIGNKTYKDDKSESLSYSSKMLIKSEYYINLSVDDKSKIIEKRLKNNCGGIFKFEGIEKEMGVMDVLSDAEGRIVKKLWNENPNLALYNKAEWERRVSTDPDVIKAKNKLDNFREECSLLREELKRLKK